MPSSTKPKERPILFRGDLVRGIVEGRKTVARRPVKLSPDGEGLVYSGPDDGEHLFHEEEHPEEGSVPIPCPYGVPGDRLWVREAWRKAECGNCDYGVPGSCQCMDTPFYRADFEHPGKGWTPSIYMPRWASRLLLEVTEVRVERLQEITEEEAVAEGFEASGGLVSGPMDPAEHDGHTAVQEFAAVWDEAYRYKGLVWDASPWVWVVRFKRLEAPNE